MTRPPTYDERMDEVGSLGSILSNPATTTLHPNIKNMTTAKDPAPNAAILSTTIDDPHQASSHLNAISSTNHRQSVQPASSQHLNSAVDIFYAKSRGSQPNAPVGYPLGSAGSHGGQNNHNNYG